MSVPLDRLYNYFDDLVDCNLIIYRYYPHGSKKLSDLTKLNPCSYEAAFYDPIVVCCDQEPLDLDAMFDSKSVREIAKSRWKQMCGIELSPDVIAFISQAGGPMFLNNLNINDHLILLHSEKNSKNVRMAEEFGAIPVYCWSHGFLAKDWFRYAEHAPMLNFKSCLPKFDFLVYNRAWSGTREYRLKFSELILEKNLLKQTKITFNPVDQTGHYVNHQYLNPAFKIQRKDLEDHIELNTATSASSSDFCVEDYQQTGIEIVLETLFDDARIQLTEKILRPIACGHPFILASTVGSLQYLRSYGFKTFHPYVNECYDSISNPLRRLQAIIDEMQRISNLDIKEKHNLFCTLNKIAEYNKEHFFSDRFWQQLVYEYRTEMKSAIAQTAQSRSGHTVKIIGDLLQKHHNHDKNYRDHIINKLIQQYLNYTS